MLDGEVYTEGPIPEKGGAFLAVGVKIVVTSVSSCGFGTEVLFRGPFSFRV